MKRRWIIALALTIAMLAQPAAALVRCGCSTDAAAASCACATRTVESGCCDPASEVTSHCATAGTEGCGSICECSVQSSAEALPATSTREIEVVLVASPQRDADGSTAAAFVETWSRLAIPPTATLQRLAKLNVWRN